MRVQNTLKNMKIGLFFTILYLMLSFVGRGIFVRIFGPSIAGFNVVVLNLMSFLNVVELGVGMAITYSLYKPLSTKDYSRINEIMVLFRYYYRNIAKIICVSGILLGCILNLFVKNQIPLVEAYLYYFMFLFNTIIIYFVSYKQVLIIADQKQYIIVVINNTVRIIKILVQLLIMYLTRNYFLWIVLEILFNVVNLMLIDSKANRLYSEISFKSEKNIERIKEENKGILKDMKDVFFHKIASFIVFQTDGILISIFLNLKQTAIYGNYMMVINGVLLIFNSVMGSFTASIGNLVAEGNNEKNFDIFKKLYLIDHFIAIILTYILYNVINDFIILWVGKDYLFNQGIVLVLMINVYIQIIRGTIEKFKDTYGIFWDRFASILEGVINLVVSYILIQYLGVIGLFIGTLMSNIIIILIWKPYVVYKYGFKRNMQEHMWIFLKMVLLAIIIFIIADSIIAVLLSNLILENLILKFLIESSVKFIIITLLTSSIFLFNKDFKDVINMVLGKSNKEKVKLVR